MAITCKRTKPFKCTRYSTVSSQTISARLSLINLVRIDFVGNTFRVCTTKHFAHKKGGVSQSGAQLLFLTSAGAVFTCVNTVLCA